MSNSNYLTLVKASAVYDLILTTAFAIPFVAGLKISLLQQLHLALNLSGTFPDFESVHLFFVNLMGSVVVIWSVLRLRRPLEIYGYYDALSRFLFSFAMIYALTVGQASQLILFLLVPELAWGVVQWWRYPNRKENIAQAV